MTLIESAPVGTNLHVLLNGKALNIVESNPEFAFAYWGQRQRKANDNRRYTLVSERGVIYHHQGDQWRAA